MNDQVTGDNIINEFNNGSPDSLSALFNLHYTPLCYFAKRIVADQEEAEDIVVNAFVNLWDKRPEVQSMKNLKSYLYRATKNACINHLKKLDRTTKLESDLLHLLSENDDHALANMIKAEIFQEIYKAIEALPSQCKKIVWMSFMEGRKNQEIADLLNLSVQTVKNQKLRGITLLKMKLLDSNILVLLWLYSHLSNKN